MEVGGSAPNLPNLHHFKAARDRPMTLEEAKLQMQEAKSLVDLIAEREKSEKKIRRNEYHLATTTQLTRIQNAIKVDSVIAQEMFDKMIYVIEARDDIVEARKIIHENLDDLG
ncbi:hypothetical protein Tco_0756608 [Tanacetum coccineum]